MLAQRADLIKEIGAAAFLSLAIVGSIGALSSSVADHAEAKTTMVDRTNKSDRLTPAPTLIRVPNGSSPTDIVLSIRPLLGCDPAFSPVADPERAQIFRRCIT